MFMSTQKETLKAVEKKHRVKLSLKILKWVYLFFRIYLYFLELEIEECNVSLFFGF